MTMAPSAGPTFPYTNVAPFAAPLTCPAPIVYNASTIPVRLSARNTPPHGVTSHGH